jgi:hypothetical protein
LYNTYLYKSNGKNLFVFEAERLKKEAKAKNAASTSSPRGGRGRGRRGRRGRAAARTPPPTADNTVGTSGIATRSRTAVIVDEILVSSDNEPEIIEDVAAFVDLGSDFTEDSDNSARSNSDSDSDDVEGVRGTYYGGYGTCYRCGE